jgi:hypothetical protein
MKICFHRWIVIGSEKEMPEGKPAKIISALVCTKCATTRVVEAVYDQK